MNEPNSLLHVFSTFAAGGAQARAATLMNALGPAWQHTVVSMDSNHQAAAWIDRSTLFTQAPAPPVKSSLFCPLYFRKLIRRIRPSLVATYNWGAIDAVAGTLIAGVCPVIHTEDGFGSDEAVRLRERRVLARRVFLNAAYATVVPSHTLEEIALKRYRITPRKVRFIANGVDTDRFRPGLARSERAALGATDDTVVFGFVGQLRPEKRLEFLLRAFHDAAIPQAILVIVGDGACRAELTGLAQQLGIADRVRFQGNALDPAALYAAFDVFVLSSVTEQMPMSLLEAMAAGLPAVCTDVGDIPTMLRLGGPQVVSHMDSGEMSRSMQLLAGDPELRARLGESNRNRCTAEYSLDRMVRQYAALYAASVEGSTNRRRSGGLLARSRRIEGM